jgi:hypothetical protein
MSTVYPASDAQISYLSALMAKREWPTYLTPRADIEARLSEGTLDGRTASRVIDALKGAPVAVATKGGSAVATLSVGMYRTPDGTMYRVQESRESGRLYAKRMKWDMLMESKPRFEYDRGAIYSLTSADRMSVEDARAWGVETGVCCVCGAFLTDAKSVARGIGPVCEGRV